MIHEAVITTTSADDGPHIAPLGFRYQDDYIVLAPFRPSTTLDNLQRRRYAVLNLTDNVAIIAGCLTGRKDWPTVPVRHIAGNRLEDTLVHLELEVERVEDDSVRPRFFCRVKHQEIHAPYKGFNRAQAAVIEVAILVSRLHMLPADKIDSEVAYHGVAIEKTSGERERLAWQWLMERIANHRAEQSASPVQS